MPIDISNLLRWKKASKLETQLRRVRQVANVNQWGGRTLPTNNAYRPMPSKLLHFSIPSVNVQTLDVAGSFAPVVADLGFSYVAAYDSLVIYFDGSNGSQRLVVRRSDGYKEALPLGSLMVSGLTASAPGGTGATYYAYPFWIPQACYIGWVPGDVGDPRILHLAPTLDALHKQRSTGREPLSTGALTLKLLGVPAPAPTGTGGTGTTAGGTTQVASLSLTLINPYQGATVQANFNLVVRSNKKIITWSIFTDGFSNATPNASGNPDFEYSAIIGFIDNGNHTIKTQAKDLDGLTGQITLYVITDDAALDYSPPPPEPPSDPYGPGIG